MQIIWNIWGQYSKEYIKDSRKMQTHFHIYISQNNFEH